MTRRDPGLLREDVTRDWVRGTIRYTVALRMAEPVLERGQWILDQISGVPYFSALQVMLPGT